MLTGIVAKTDQTKLVLGGIGAAVLAMAAVVAVSGGAAQADMVTVNAPMAIPLPSGGLSLSTGTLDWAHWGEPGDASPGNTFTPIIFDHATTTGFSALTFSGYSIAATGYNPGVTTGNPQFTWSGGTPDVTGSTYSFGNQDVASLATTVTFTLSVAADTSEVLSVYANTYDGGSTGVEEELQATLSTSGTTGYNTAALPTGPDSEHQQGVYAVDISNTTLANETLTVNYFRTSGTSGGLGIYAATVTPTPEPTTLAVLAAASVGLLLLKRRRTV
jgi:hypothetical protein